MWAWMNERTNEWMNVCMYVWMNVFMYECMYDHYPFKGDVPKLQDTINVFEGGGPGKCQQAFIFLSAFYLQDVILVGPLTLYRISFIFF